MEHDYSTWLTPERLEAEERLWESDGIHHLYAKALVDAATEEGVAVAGAQRWVGEVIEFGCGTGWTALRLGQQLAELGYKLRYTGVDANQGCITKAKQRAPSRMFLHGDVRTLAFWAADIVCAFAFFKHFALAEWPRVADKVLRYGRVGVFTMNVGERDSDDFTNGFAHTWVTPETLAKAVHAAGHSVKLASPLHTGETLVRTVRREL